VPRSTDAASEGVIALQTPDEADLRPPTLQRPVARPAAWEAEPRSKRLLFLLVALSVVAAYGYLLFSFCAPAPGRPGIDENAYLVAGKNLAQSLTTGFKPGDDYQFVGAMWIRSAAGWYYPKYPFGLPLLNAAPVLLQHREWAFAIAPICTCLAVLGMFFLSRGIVGSFYAVLATIVLAMGPTTLQLSDIPNSHAPALCFVVWGMFFVFRWYRTGERWTGLLAGFLLGFAVTIRYTEALLLFPLQSLDVLRVDQFIGPGIKPLFKVLGFLPLGPLGVAAIARLKWKSRRSYLRSAVPILAWAAPVGALLIFNKLTLGQLTGYDQTNESGGFSISYFQAKWDFSVYQMYLFALFFVFPIGLLGLVLMFRGAKMTAVLLCLWFFPGALLYTAYYWGNDLPGMAYLRFLLTLIPPLIIAAMWVLRTIQPATGGAIAAPLAAGLLTVVATVTGLGGSIDELARQHRGTMNLYDSAQRIIAHAGRNAGAKPMILADDGMFPPLLQYLQFMLDADWYASDAFVPRVGGGFGLVGVFQKIDSDSNVPVGVQRSRIDYMEAIRKGKSADDFARIEQGLMRNALGAGRRVFAVLSPTYAKPFRQRYITPEFEMVELERWSEPCNVPYPTPGERDWLTLPGWPDDIITPWHRQSRVMFEIRRAPTTQPVATENSHHRLVAGTH
jgi:hypothetical protein